MTRAAPIIEKHGHVHVVRDDLYPGGTKARFLTVLYQNAEEVVYASPAEGGAQTALAFTAKALGKKATIFVAKRKTPHPRAYAAKAAGALVMQVKPGYLNVVQARAREYCERTGALLAPFGLNLPEALDVIATDAARGAEEAGVQPTEVWCASGSGVLARSLARAFPGVPLHCVQVGRELSPEDVAGGTIHAYPKPFSHALAAQPPFPSDRHYDAKAWQVCAQHAKPGALFWNVTGPADA